MKKIIAGTALVATLLTGGASAAFAETATGTTAPTTTAATAPVTTSTDATATAPATTTTTTAAPATTTTATTDTQLQLPDVSLTPDKLFYGLKLFLEKLQVAMTMDAINKGTVLEQQAQTRLAEAKAMADAGKMDLAQQALTDAKASLAAAQKQVTTAMTANKDVTKLSAELRADELKFATVLGMALQSAPDTVKAQMEPVVAQMLAQVAAQPVQPADAVQTQQPAQETEQAKAANQEIYTRKELLLKAMAQASGKSPEEVQALFAKNPGLGRIAKALGVKMGDVQHAAQAAWKAQQAGAATQPDATATTTTAPATTGAQADLQAQLQSLQADIRAQAQSLKQDDREDEDKQDDAQEQKGNQHENKGQEKQAEKKAGKH